MYVTFKGTMTKWSVKPTHRTTQKHVEQHEETHI